MRRPELLLATAAVVLVAVPMVLSAPPHGARETVGALCSVAGALALAGWRRFPVAVLALGPALLLAPAGLGPEPSTYLLLVLMAYAALAAERFSGWGAVVAALAFAAYLAVIYVATGEDDPGTLVLVLPGYLAGTALRLRRATAEELAERGRELDLEQELFARLSVHNERARIASELHDIVGHALSVMVVQAAAGQRLVDRSPADASASLAAVAASARRGQQDLRRLIDLLSGSPVGNADLSLVDDLVEHASRSGLPVTCRFEGDRDGLSAAQAHTVVRVVQEGLTNALRHAPGAEVRVLVRGAGAGRSVTVQVDNGPPPAHEGTRLVGTGRGLRGLRERVQTVGGSFSAGPHGDGWRVEARLSPAGVSPIP